MAKLTKETSLRNDVTVIIRTVGERTTELCNKLVLEQIPPKNVFVIEEVPFAKAVKRTFEIGLENGLPWTVAVDADILLADQAISQAISLAEKEDRKIFKFNGLVVDKLLCGKRYICPHIYRTSLCEIALANFPEGNFIRPEMTIANWMSEQKEYRMSTLDCLLGLHDYEQYYRDIFRKGFVHANKFNESTLNGFLKRWSMEMAKENDFKVALIGLCVGLAYQETIEINRDKLPTNYRDYEPLSDLEEKAPLTDNEWNTGEKIRSYISDLLYSRSHPTLSEIRNFTIETDFIKLIPGIIGLVFQSIGKKMFDWAQK